MKRGLIVLCLIFISLVQLSLPAQAASKTSGLTIAPLRFYPTQAPGVATGNNFQLTNSSKNPLSVALSTELFTTTDENYDYSFTSTAGQDWIRFDDQQLTLLPNEKKTENFTVSVPSDAKPGGYYFSLIASTVETPSTTSFTEIKRVSALVYLEVSGDVVHKISLLSKDVPWFTTNRTVSVTARISNQGTTHERVSMPLPYRYLPWGKLQDNPALGGLILPGTIRKVDGSIKLLPYPGLYKVYSSFSPLGAPTVRTTHYILYTPIWFIVLVGYITISLIWRRYELTKKLDLKRN